MSKMNNKRHGNMTVVLPTAQLRKLCDHAEALGLPEGPNAKFWNEVDEEGRHVVSFNYPRTGIVTFASGKEAVRAMILCKMRGRLRPQGLLCDFDQDDFSTLVRNGRWATNRRKKSPSAK
jgi:hypothetical protein